MRAALMLAFAALAAATPLHAAEPPTADGNGPVGDIALRCVVWSSLAGTSEDPAAVEAFQLTMTYFVGLAEGQTGRKIGELLTPAFVETAAANPGGLEETCLPLMADIGTRLMDLGDELQHQETTEAATAD